MESKIPTFEYNLVLKVSSRQNKTITFDISQDSLVIKQFKIFIKFISTFRSTDKGSNFMHDPIN